MRVAMYFSLAPPVPSAREFHGLDDDNIVFHYTIPLISRHDSAHPFVVYNHRSRRGFTKTYRYLRTCITSYYSCFFFFFQYFLSSFHESNRLCAVTKLSWIYVEDRIIIIICNKRRGSLLVQNGWCVIVYKLQDVCCYATQGRIETASRQYIVFEICRRLFIRI